MRLIEVNRIVELEETTFSNIFVDGVKICDGLEDAYRPFKIDGKTRIPAGTYDITARTWGGFHERYKNARWISDIYVGMPWIRNVPGFQYILIHAGNNKWDTEGCLLTGDADFTRLSVWNSRLRFRQLYEEIRISMLARDLKIEFKDSDR